MKKSISFLQLIIYVLGTWSLPCPTLKAQKTEPTWNKNIGLALSHFQISEEALLPIVHQGIGPGIRLEALKKEGSNIDRLALNVEYIKPKSKYESDFKSQSLAITLNYISQKKREKENLAIGYIVAAAYRLNFFEEWDDSHFFWLTNYFVGVSGSFTLPIKKSKNITLSASIPLVNFISRPPSEIGHRSDSQTINYIASRMHRDLKIKSMNQHFSISWVLSIINITEQNRPFNLLIKGEYIYSNLKESKKYKSLNQQLGVQFYF